MVSRCMALTLTPADRTELERRTRKLAKVLGAEGDHPGAGSLDPVLWTYADVSHRITTTTANAVHSANRSQLGFTQEDRNGDN